MNALPRKVVSVEDLVTWAYRDQMVHVASRVEMVALAPSHAPKGYAGNGFALEIADVSRPVSFTASPDAFAVHDAVKALPTVEAHLPADVVAKCAASMHHSAMPVFGVRFPVNQANLVFTHALSGKPPDWIPDPVLVAEKGLTIYAKHRGTGQVKRDQRGLPVVALCAVTFIGDQPWDVERARITYRIWVKALAALKGMLRPTLTRHTLTDGLPPEEPWSFPVASFRVG